jgi:RNA polymerase sigma-70 factor (ECF subfamily)
MFISQSEPSTIGRAYVSHEVSGTGTERAEPGSTRLVERLKAGDERAFEELVETYRERVYRVAWRILRDDESAEDAAQEAFIKVFRHIRRFEGRSSVYTWLYRITVNIALNKLKRDRFRRMVPLGDVVRSDHRPEADPVRAAMSSEVARRIDEAVASLPDKQKAVFTLKFYEHMSHKEIAGIVGCSEGTSKANYFHAIRKLRKLLGDLV